MKNVLKQVLAITASVILVFSAGGIGLFSHYCSCTGFEFQSVFVPVNCDDHHGAAQCRVDVEEEHANNCCSNHASENEGDDPFCNLPEGCCLDELTVLKTDIFDYSKSPRLFVKSLIAVQVIFHEIDDADLVPSLKFSSTGFINDLPPPLYGKDLLHSIHQLKFDIPLV